MREETLSRSSVEFVVGLFIAIIAAVFPMTWWLKLILIAILIPFVVDLTARSPWTIKWCRIVKTGVSFAIIFVLFATYSFSM